MAEAPATTCACTRLHIGEASRPPDVAALRAFVDSDLKAMGRDAVLCGETEGLAAALDALNALLAADEGASGLLANEGEMTRGDFALLPFLSRLAEHFGDEFISEQRPQLSDFLERVRKRPAYHSTKSDDWWWWW